MNKNSFTKKFLSLLLVGTLLTSLFCGTTLVARADDPTGTLTDYYNYIQDKQHGAITNTYSPNTTIKNAIGTSYAANGLMPYDLGAQMVWYHEDLVSFYVDGLGKTSWTDTNYSSYFKFAASVDGNTWTDVTFVRTRNETFPINGFTSERLTLQSLPSGAKYIKLTSDSSNVWSNGVVLGVGIVYSVDKPIFTAAYKNIKGAYVNPLANGGTATRAVKLEIGNFVSTDTVSATKDGQTFALNFNSAENGYIFTEDGSYTVTATNVAGAESFSFTVAKTDELTCVETVVDVNTLQDNILGTTDHTYEKTNALENALAPSQGIKMYGYWPNQLDDYACWTQEGMATFAIDGMAPKNATEDTLKQYFVLKSSIDGQTWTDLKFTYSKIQDYANNFSTYKLTVYGIPDGTTKVKLTYGGDAIAWSRGIVTGVHYSFLTPVSKPTISASYKNYFGYYANTFTTGATIVKDAEIKVTGMELPEVTEAKVEITKDGVPVTAADYYNATSDAYYFSEKGAYLLTASNKTGSESFNFTIAENTDVGTYVSQDVLDDIYTTGVTKAYEKTEKGGDLTFAINALSHINHKDLGYATPELADSRYIMWAYNSRSAEPSAYASWYDENGIGRFVVETLNLPSVNEAQLRNAYGFYYSADGQNWIPVDFEIGRTLTTEGLTSNAKSVELCVNNLPDDTKYVRFMSLNTNAETGEHRYYGIIRVRYSYPRLVIKPEISGVYANMVGKYTSPLVSGGTATRKAMLKITEMETGGTVTVKKNGEAVNTADYYNADDDAYYFCKDGKYDVIAENAAGKSEFSFTVALKEDKGHYVELENVYDIFNKNIDGTIANTYSNNPVQDALIKMGSLPVLYSYYPSSKNGTYTNDDLYMLWNEENVSSFTLDVMARSSTNDEQFSEHYILYASADGENWTRLSFDRELVQGYQNNLSVYRLTVKVIPEGTNFVRLSYGGTTYGWDLGAVTGATVSYFHKIEKPEFTAEYKNLYGTYANVLKDGGKAIRDVKISVTEMGDGTGGVLTIKKDGNTENVSEYYVAADDSYVFTADGDYVVTAENKEGKSSFSFTVDRKTEEPIETKTVTDDIYTTGKTIAYERIDISGGDYKIVMSMNSFAHSNHADLGYVTAELAESRFVMWPFNHGKATAETYATWKSDTGFGSFAVYTVNATGTADANYFKNYSFLYSSDGINWTVAEFTVGEKVMFEGLTEKAVSRKLLITKIPDGVKYIKFLSLMTDETKGYGRYNGIIGAEYTTVISKPAINANYKDIQGMYINPLCDGAVAPSTVLLNATDVGAGVPDSSLVVKKNGTEIPFTNGEELKEDGKYEVTATNRKGTSTLEFTIKNVTKQPASTTYIFTGGLVEATENYEKLLAITPAGADEKFTKGDGAIIVNDTIANNKGNSAYDHDKWGLPEGGTNITVGSDSKGYKKDGYFYFSNTDEKGNKYTAISLTYSIPVAIPKASITISTADKFDGDYKLVTPTTVTLLRTSERVNVYKAIYYLGSAGSVVKVQYNPKAPITSLWQGGMLAIQELTKLSLPTLKATSDGKALSYNDVTKKDVKLNVSGDDFWFITKDGEPFAKPKNNTLTEDGYYTVYACNYSGTASVSFYLAKKIPVVQMIDVLDNNLTTGDVTDDDVHVISHNAKKVEILRDGEFYSDKKDIVLNLNGTYSITATNNYGTFTAEVIINRPLPTLLAYNFRNSRVNDGDVVPTSVVYTVDTADKYTITRDGKVYKPETEGTLTEEGNYVITAVNDAGKVTLSFTLKYNAPLKPYVHKGNTVHIVDYENDAKITDSLYKSEEIFLDKGKALQSTWTGFTGSILRPTVSGEGAESYIIYKSVGFESFVVHAAHLPELPTEQIYELYVSVNGRDYQKLECDIEEDISYVARSTNFNKFRISAKNIPEGAKYIKVLIRGDEAKYLWSRCITGVEYSYDSSKVGKLDVDDTIFMMEDAEEGSEVLITLHNTDTVIPKRVFESFKDSDKTLTVNLIDKEKNSLYRLSFNGLNNRESMDFNVKVTRPDSAGLKYVKAKDQEAFSVSFAQDGEWTMDVSFAVVMGKENNGKRYALYKFTDGVLELMDRQLVPVSGLLTFQITGNGDYVISAFTNLVSDDNEYVDDEIIIEEEPKTEETKDDKYIMVVNRKKFVPFAKDSLSTLVIVLICVASVLLAGAVVTTVLLVVKHKKKSKN